MTDPWAAKIAQFVIQALELDVDSGELASEIVPLKRDADAGISALELASSIGPTPFLVYHYDISVNREALDTDLATLEKAATLDTPGPRIVAHAIAGNSAFILATTPSIQRAMTGKATAPPPSPGEQKRARTRLPDRLGDTLREANTLAGQWLAAIDAARAQGQTELTRQEAALALQVLDEGSVQNLLRALNVLLASARHTAAESLK
jgi:hypothetical protein